MENKNKFSSLKTICSYCDQENCDGVIYICTACGDRACKNLFEKEFYTYGKMSLKEPNKHLYVRGHGQIWICGPIEPLTDKNNHIQKTEIYG